MMPTRLVDTGRAPASSRLLRYLPMLGLLVVAVSLAVVGGMQAAETIVDGLRDHAVFAPGQEIATSFGSLTIREVEKMDGLTAQDLSGVTHGIQNLVMSDKVQIQTTLTFANRSDTPLALSPAQFQLAGEDEDSKVSPSSGTLLTGILPPHANLDVVLDFVTPRTNRPLWIEYAEPGQEQPLRIAIGPADSSAGEIPPVPEVEHSHAD